jgi:dCMP deaminase
MDTDNVLTAPTKWEKRYLELAKSVASWSRDPSRKIGAVIVGNHGQIISQGFNGFARGVDDTPERYGDRETKYKFVVHAEANAIYNAIHNGASPSGATIFVTGLPVCHQCADAIIQTGVKRVVMDTLPCTGWEESGNLALQKFKEAQVEFKFVSTDLEDLEDLGAQE